MGFTGNFFYRVILKYLYLFIYLAVLGLSCSMQDLQSLQHVGSSSLIRD